MCTNSVCAIIINGALSMFMQTSHCSESTRLQTINIVGKVPLRILCAIIIIYALSPPFLNSTCFEATGTKRIIVQFVLIIAPLVTNTLKWSHASNLVRNSSQICSVGA